MSSMPPAEPARPSAERTHASDLWDDAKASARDTLERERESAAAGMGDVADALRDAARRRRDDGDERFAHLTASAADGLQRLSGTLRSKDVGAMLRDVDDFAHRQPAVFFGLAVVAGFCAARYLRSPGGR